MPALRKLLTSPTVALLVIRLGGAGAGFLSQLVLARLLAPQGDLGLFLRRDKPRRRGVNSGGPSAIRKSRRVSLRATRSVHARPRLARVHQSCAP